MAQWRPAPTYIRINMSLGDDVMSDGTKPLNINIFRKCHLNMATVLFRDQCVRAKDNNDASSTKPLKSL